MALFDHEGSGPNHNTNFYFVDKCLPFGSSVSCSHFQRVSNAICHIIKFKSGLKHSITNYLDDFLFTHCVRQQCDELIDQFLDICASIAFPVANDKTERAAPHVTFLCILLDGVRQCLAVPQDKLVRALHLLHKRVDKRKTTVKEIQRLAGTLNFLTKVVHPGRTFLRRMYAKYSNVVDGNSKLKHYHHIKVDQEFKCDCRIRITFLEHANHVTRPFVDFESTEYLSILIGHLPLGKRTTYRTWSPA